MGKSSTIIVEIVQVAIKIILKPAALGWLASNSKELVFVCGLHYKKLQKFRQIEKWANFLRFVLKVWIKI